MERFTLLLMFRFNFNMKLQARTKKVINVQSNSSLTYLDEPWETASMAHNMMIAINTQGRRINKTIFYHYLSPQRPSVKNIGLKNATKVCVVWGIGGVHRTDRAVKQFHW